MIVSMCDFLGFLLILNCISLRLYGQKFTLKFVNSLTLHRVPFSYHFIYTVKLIFIVTSCLHIEDYPLSRLAVYPVQYQQLFLL